MTPAWQSKCGSVVFYLGDCLDVIRHLPQHIDSMITDPPYGVGLKARVTKHTKRSASQNYDDDGDVIGSEVIKRVEAYLGIVKNACIATGVRMLQSYPQAADIGGVFMPNGAGCGPWGFTCFHPVLFYGKCPYLARQLGSRPTSTRATHWLSDEVDHPCPKPVEFMQWMVERASWPGETVIDPFVGSGTCAIACIKSGRRFIGVEKESKFLEMSIKRTEIELRSGPKGKLNKDGVEMFDRKSFLSPRTKKNQEHVSGLFD